MRSSPDASVLDTLKVFPGVEFKSKGRQVKTLPRKSFRFVEMESGLPLWRPDEIAARQTRFQHQREDA